MHKLLDRTRPWLTVTGAALLLALLLPPAADYARRYAFVQASQFVVFAVAGPAMLVLGRPAWHQQEGTAGEMRPTAPAITHAATLRLLAFLAAVIGWRLPAALSALARDPILTVAEMVSLTAAGCGIWFELAGASASRPPLPRPIRAAVAAVAMWTIWVIAYVTGMSGAATATPGRGDAVATAVSTAADRQIAVGVMWAVPAICFVPVVYVMLLTWLSASDDPDHELGRLTGPCPPSVPGPSPIPRPPRGWRSPRPPIS